MNYKTFYSLKLSEIGLGTYLGNPDKETDTSYYNTIKKAISFGVNVIDTAINYRNMRSERVIGEVLYQVERDNLVISTKGGYIPVDSDYAKNPQEWFRRELLDSGILSKSDITPYGNVLTPKYISWSFNRSLKNLKTSYIDVYFIHNPEDQLQFLSREVFYERLKSVFSFLEEKVQEGKLKFYGLATWNGFRVPESNKQFLDLPYIVNLANEVAGDNHHFRFIQLPYNLAMPEAYFLKNQSINGEKMSTLEASEKLGIYTYISAPLLQGRLLSNLPEALKDILKVPKENLIPIQFVRSTPGVGTVLIGMSKEEHLKQNLEIENYEKVSKETIETLIKNLKTG